MQKELDFPNGFLWGSAVSSYQVEGGIENCNWSKDFPAGNACDFWNRNEEYFDIAKELNQNVHRLSLEWSRIEPKEGKFDNEAIEHYKKMLMSLRERNIKTMVTLWHSTTPIWLCDKGGWTNFQMPEYFQNYVSFVVGELDEYVDFWITINEPVISASFSYILGEFPPKKKNDFIGFLKAIFNFAIAHKRAYYAIKNISPKTSVAMAENYSYVEAYNNESYFNKSAVYIWNFLRNRMFLEYTKKEQDFLGINYYFHEKIKIDSDWPFFKILNDNLNVTDLEWEIFPRGIYEVIIDLKKYNLPIYITENGIADKNDIYRDKFIKEHLEFIHKAVEQNADVRGYLYWSLMDNFEWTKGYKPRFGLVEINYETMVYKIRPSAFEYAKICKNNKLTI
jgi:beta-glucosidase